MFIIWLFKVSLVFFKRNDLNNLSLITFDKVLKVNRVIIIYDEKTKENLSRSTITENHNCMKILKYIFFNILMRSIFIFFQIFLPLCLDILKIDFFFEFK